MNFSKVKDICNHLFQSIKEFFIGKKSEPKKTIYEIAYDPQTGESLYMDENHRNHVLQVMVRAEEWHEDNKWTPYDGDRLSKLYEKHRKFTNDEYRRKLFKD
jgi:hypothetical protein